MYQKYLIRCTLVVRTGMHIGGSAAFSAIGAVDSPVVRDPYTGQPIVPGSSLKGKLRTLLARSLSTGKGKGIEDMPDYNQDEPPVLRLFGAANPVRRSRLQFADAFVTNANRMAAVGLTEVKTENGISRGNAVANPRQIERVVAGTEFGVNIVYDAVDPDETRDDLTLLAKGMKLLQLDYLGGHGSRGSGRVSLLDFHVTDCETGEENKELTGLFDEVANYELFPDRAGL